MTSLSSLTLIGGRVLGALCLYVGLMSAASLLGVHGGSQNPVAYYGPVAFTYLTVFSLGFLFAAVGIWIGSNWGSVVAILTALAEMAVALFGDVALELPAIDFMLALVVLIAGVGLFVLGHLGVFLPGND